MDLDINAASYRSLTARLQDLHDRLLHASPDIDRVACALYDPVDDLLKTFINSTHNGSVLRAHQYRLADSESLSHLARTRELRLLTDIPGRLEPTTVHSAYVLAEGYQSSLTIPMSHRDEFLGFVFFDSRSPTTFTPELQRELLVYAGLIAMAVANELIAVRSIIGTVQIARSFTQLRDTETGEHLTRMSRYARIIARGLVEPLGLDDEFVEHLHLYAPLHDIGKIGIPDRILLKPGPLDPDEWEVMKTHTTKGREMIDTIVHELVIDDLPDVDMLRAIVEHHHEALDGSGYPHGLVGGDIPLAARIVAVADVYDALTSARVYKPAWSVAASYAELDRMVARGKLDEQCVAALRADAEAVDEVRLRHREPDQL